MGQALDLQGIVHCDVTPGNVLLRSDGSLCLCDFFYALDLRSQDLVFERVGSLDYMPPEMIALATPEEKRSGLDVSDRPVCYGTPVDVWQVRHLPLAHVIGRTGLPLLAHFNSRRVPALFTLTR